MKDNKDKVVKDTTVKDTTVKDTTVKTEIPDLNAVLDTIKELKEELKKVKEENKRFSESEKKAIEEAREEMITDEDEGPCYLDPKYKMEGYYYRATDLTRPNIIEKRLRQGYEIARYSDTTDMEKSSSYDKTSLTDAITLQLGTTRDCPGVWMRTPLENFQKRQRAKERKNRQNLDEAVNSGSAGAQFGEITIGDNTHFKQD